MGVRAATGLLMQATLGASAGALRHLNWWLAWHSRPRPAEGSRDLDGSAIAASPGD
jgi:hypothetical protein